MPRKRNPEYEKARELYNNGDNINEIALNIGIKPGTIRSWKSRYNWDGDPGKENKKKDRNVAKEKKLEKRIVAKEVKKVISNQSLTDKQRMFCLYYVRCFNATKAYLKAYGGEYETAMVEGCKLKQNPKIKKMIQELKEDRFNMEMLEETDIFQKYLDMAFSNMTDFVKFGKRKEKFLDEEGKVYEGEASYLEFKESDMIDGTLITEIRQGKNGISMKLENRQTALKWLTDHKYMATEEQLSRMRLIKEQTKKVEEETKTIKKKRENIW